jgi:xylulose-5-phosphate/fructose-6-phosphate phosphoketolase
MTNVLSNKERALMDAYWRAANYLSVGQIYLYDNPLLKQSLTKDHIKPRLLGHWGTTPGLNFIYVHLNRVIKKHDLDMIYVTGPGHGGPGLVANAYLEGTYSEVYPNISSDEEGMKRLFTQFSCGWEAPLRRRSRLPRITRHPTPRGTPGRPPTARNSGRAREPQERLGQ